TTAGQYTVVSYSDMYAVDMDAYYYYGSEEYTFDAENALTTAIGRVTRTVSYDLYELTGHGETALGSDFVETLNNAGVTVQELNLTTAGSIPEEAASLLINAPIADVTAEEAALLSDYLAGGGKL